MIGKITLGKSFRGCISYLLEDKLDPDGKIVHENRSAIICYNQCFGTKKELTSQFGDVRRLNPRLAKPVMHISLSLSPGEKLEKPSLINLAEECAKDMWFERNQYLAVTHNDTGHQHIHIVVNRVGFDGRTCSDSNNFKKIAAFCRKAELKYGLQQVASPGKFLPKEKRQTLRFDTRKEAMKKAIGLTLLESKTYEDFESKMKQKGCQIIKARGIAFMDEKKMYAKGSELGYSLGTIKKMLSLSLAQKQVIIQKQIRDKKPVPQIGKVSYQQLSKSRAINHDPAIARARALELLLNPGRDNSITPHELLPIKRKRKKLSQHL